MNLLKITYFVDNENWDDDEYNEKTERVISIPIHYLVDLIEDNAIDLKRSEGEEIINIGKVEIKP